MLLTSVIYRSCTAFAGLLIGCILVTSPVAADTLYGNNPPPPAIISKIAAELGIPKGSKFYSNFVLLTEPSMQTKEFVAPAIQNSEGTPPNILRHIRSTKGIALPKPAPEKEIRFTPTRDNSAIHKKWRDQMAQRNTNPRPIPACTNDTSDRIPSKFTGSKAQQDIVLFDMLFVRKEQTPIDPEEVIGKRTMIVQYTDQEANVKSIAASGVKIPCLPYRIRGTAKFFIKDQGINALKNYDKDPNGSGTMHEMMQKKLQQQG